MSQDPFEIILQNAELLFSRGNYREAFELLGRAEKAALENNRQDALAAIYFAIGNNLADLGDFENAKKYLDLSLEISEKLVAEMSIYNNWVVAILNNLGNLLQQDKDFSQALDYHSRSLNLVSRSGNPDLIFRIFWSRGRCHERIDNLEEAYEDYRDSIDQIEHIRSQFSLEEYKLDIMRDKEGAYSDMISFLCTRKEDVRRAWEYVGRAKSRTLLEYLRLIELPAPQSIPEDIRKNEKKLIESIRILDRQARKSEKADEVYSNLNSAPLGYNFFKIDI